MVSNVILVRYAATIKFVYLFSNVLIIINIVLRFQPLVVKPDQLIKRRGKLGLIAVNKTFPQVKEWVNERMGKDQKIGNAVGKLRTFIIEPFIPHQEVSTERFESMLYPRNN